MGIGSMFSQNLSSDAIHNRNCYAYFLQLKPVIDDKFTALIPQLQQLKTLINEEYQESFPYGDLYSLFISSLEEKLEAETILTTEQMNIVDNIVEATYHNNNEILDQKMAGWINDIASISRPQQRATSEKIAKKMQDPAKLINKTSPNETENLLQRLYSVISSNFKPQQGTNIPSIKNYAYKTSQDPVEYRFSTQAQRHNGEVRISPLFKKWLQIRADKYPEQEINHIYFNNLGYDRSGLDLAGVKERELTQALHTLEEDPNLKIMVITLPAHDGLMDVAEYENTTDTLSYPAVFNELLAVAQGQKHKSGVSDFIISPWARKKLFQTTANETIILRQLLQKSFQVQGINPENHLSSAQKQAVWVHFIKYELTNYIIKTVKPKSYNFSCKDAIDRGALSSSYFNLMKSLAANSPGPMQRREFERSLDAAAANVKGRGMNFHRKIIWNALDTYVNANYTQLSTAPQKAWLIYWRDMNCPHAIVDKLLSLRLKQSFKFIANLPEKNAPIKIYGHQLLELIGKLHSNNVSGKRLLLEVVSRTCELISSPSPELATKYKDLSGELKINHPILMVIGGIMEMILGIVLYIPSLSYSHKLIEQGYATSQSGFFFRQREDLINEMNNFVQETPAIGGIDVQ